MEREFTEQELVRRGKLQELRDKGIDPFGHRIDVTTDSKALNEKYADYSKEQLAEIPDQKEETIAGRIMSIRGKGKVGFMNLQDKFGQIQVYIRKDVVGEEEYEIFKKADLGDICAIKGTIMRTDMGELTVRATHYIHLVKALRPLPEKYHGLNDVEERFRRRYVDLICNEDARRIAFARPKIIRAIQSYLDNLGYTEVETPVLGTILGGASAEPFITHHNSLDINMYLRIAVELNLKRLIVGGMDAVYEIGRDFRNEGMDHKHNPEFTMIELYKAYSDLEGMMDITEGIVRAAAKSVLGDRTVVKVDEHEVDLGKEFKRISMVDLIKEQTGIDFGTDMSFEEAKKLAEKHGIVVEPHFGYGHIVNAFFEKYCEEKVIQPTFVYGHPIEISPLAKKAKDPRFTQRFELFIGGMEYCNAFTELNDPDDQFERFNSQLKEKELGNKEANEMDMDYVEALEYGMPPTGGMGMGIDRLVMLLTEQENIREVILFPTMKPKD